MFASACRLVGSDRASAAVSGLYSIRTIRIHEKMARRKFRDATWRLTAELVSEPRVPVRPFRRDPTGRDFRSVLSSLISRLTKHSRSVVSSLVGPLMSGVGGQWTVTLSLTAHVTCHGCVPV